MAEDLEQFGIPKGNIRITGNPHTITPRLSGAKVSLRQTLVKHHRSYLSVNRLIKAIFSITRNFKSLKN